MKIAIQFYGFMRHYQITAPLWKRLIDKYKADVFIHTWDTEEYKDNTDIIPFNSSGQLSNPKPLDGDTVISLFKPKRLVAETYRDRHQEFVQRVQWMEDFRNEYLRKNPSHNWIKFSRFTSYASMYYSWLRVSQLKQIHELENDFIYDCVLHVRTDFVLTDTFSFENTNTLITPPWPNSPNTQPWVNYNIGINDYWAYGPSKVVDSYCSVYYNLERIRDFSLNMKELGMAEAINAHVIPVVNLTLMGSSPFSKHFNQHGNVLR